MDYIEYCKAYYAATGIHTALMRNTEVVYSSLAEALSLPPAANWVLPAQERNPCFCGIPPHVLYGLARVEHTDYSIVLGPAFNIPADDELASLVINLMGIPAGHADALRACLRQMPVTSGLQLARHLSLVHLSLNGKLADYDDIYATSGAPVPEASEMKARIDVLESGELHDSYYFEVEMYQKIREGNVPLLKRFLLDSALYRLAEGRMANTPLRHAKNVFITAAARTGFIGAIPGGMDVEKAYQLMDYYIRECERAATIEAVNKLQYSMVLDFCRRAGEARRPPNITTDVWHCMNYIRSHIYDTITLSDVARSVHRSTSYVIKKFRADLGIRVSAYIARCKLEEAQTMLTYTEKSLSQISSDLCFSSQSYFQNLFKREFGVTPAQYRKQSRII